VVSSTVIALRPALWRAIWVLSLTSLGCVPAARNEPTLEEKCEALERYCVDVPESRDDLTACHDVGRQGVRDPVRSDRCFVAFDECFDDCYYLYLQREDALDGG
jgi:hypothetical protein